MPQGWISTAEAAKLIGVTDGRVRQLALAGGLKGERAGRDWLISAADAKRVAKSERKPGPKPRKGGKP